MSRPSHDEIGLQHAEVAAQRGTCLRRKVGCCLTNSRNQVIATGRNGRASGMPHCNESWKELAARYVTPDRAVEYPNACAGAQAASGTQLDACEAIHAEQNALLQCGDVYQIETCYVTVSPCITCVKLLLNTSCKRIVFRERYAHDEAAMKLWSPSKGFAGGRDWILLERETVVIDNCICTVKERDSGHRLDCPAVQ
jgi:dCMP deaminase